MNGTNNGLRVREKMGQKWVKRNLIGRRNAGHGVYEEDPRQGLTSVGCNSIDCNFECGTGDTDGAD